MPRLTSPGNRGGIMVAEYSAALPHPPGINATYRVGRFAGSSCVYKTAPARTWDQDAFLLLRAAGWKPLPEGAYWLHVRCTLFTCRLDIDAPLKATLDIVAAALGVNDSCIGSLLATKVPATSRADQRLELLVRAYAVDDKADWASRSLAAIPSHKHRLLNPSI